MSYMAILKYGRSLNRCIAVFGQTPQICGARLFSQLLSRHGDEHWAVTAETCRLFKVAKIAPGIDKRDEMLGADKIEALCLVRKGISS